MRSKERHFGGLDLQAGNNSLCALGKMLNAFPSLSSFHITGYLLASPKVRKKKKSNYFCKTNTLDLCPEGRWKGIVLEHRTGWSCYSNGWLRKVIVRR